MWYTTTYQGLSYHSYSLTGRANEAAVTVDQPGPGAYSNHTVKSGATTQDKRTL